MPIISGATGNSPVSGVLVSGTAASGQVPVASGAAAGAWAYPPGFEINYTAVTSGNVNIASTTEATGTTLISPGAITFDGSLVLVHFFTESIASDTAAAGDRVIVSLFEGATQITRLAIVKTTTTAQLNVPVSAFYRFTPTAASHTYTITAFATSTTGTPTMVAGNGGTSGDAPAFVRFTKV